MKFVKEHWILIVVVVGIWWLLFAQSGANAVSSLNTYLNVNPDGTAAGTTH
jgi:hypothetical protein